MRERIASDGIRSLHDHEVLEYLLFPFVPRRNTNEIAHRLMEKFGTFSEVFNADAAALDAQDGLIRFDILAKGTGDGVGVTPRDAVVFALQSKAVSVVLAHNHPSGNPRPSQQDYDLTCAIAEALGGVSVTLADHIIYTDTESYSFEENGLLGGAAKEEF